jgi:uncharacterized protein
MSEARPTPPAVVHNPEARRFEAWVDGLLSETSYEMQGTVMRMTHTEVPAALGGRGIAGHLVVAALDHARTHGLKIQPSCSYVAGYMQRHPETQDLLAG